MGDAAELKHEPSAPKRSARPGLTALCAGAAALASLAAQASSEVCGETVTHTSPNGVLERCEMLTRMTGTTYRLRGEAQERRLCAIDLHQPTHALCPELFSTSPGTLVYDLSAGPYARQPAEFEREVCSTGHVVTVGGAISYKMSVNTRETSSRQSGWGEGSSRDFQQTAPFVALAGDKTSAEALRQGIAQGHASSVIPADVRAEQVAFWVRELIDVTLLDYLFSQQDRIGNIDYLPHWVWVEDGQVRQLPASGGKPPAEFERIAANLKSAADILRESCRAGRLRFDADPEAFMRDGKAVAHKVDCNNP